MADVSIGLGANIGNREANLRMALRGLTRMARLNAVSALYESEPEGPDQPPFYNAACHLETGLEPVSLLRFVQALEHEIGRRPGAERRGPRPIDLDILLYDDLSLDTEALTIPHPLLAERAFVLVPLSNIAPDTIHPALGMTISELQAKVDLKGVRKVREAGWDGVLGSETSMRI